VSTAERCPWAIGFGTTLHTRCSLPDGHNELNMELAGEHFAGHEGRGLAEFPYQRIRWLRGDRREYETERDDVHAWEQV
jgi:hypothetical protein